MQPGMTILCGFWLLGFSRDFHSKLEVLILGLVGSEAAELAKGCMIHLPEKQTWSFGAQRKW